MLSLSSAQPSILERLIAPSRCFFTFGRPLKRLGRLDGVVVVFGVVCGGVLRNGAGGHAVFAGGFPLVCVRCVGRHGREPAGFMGVGAPFMGGRGAG